MSALIVLTCDWTTDVGQCGTQLRTPHHLERVARIFARAHGWSSRLHGGIEDLCPSHSPRPPRPSVGPAPASAGSDRAAVHDPPQTGGPADALSCL